MSTGEEPIKIIGNESNMVYEIEPGNNSHSPNKPTVAEEDRAKEQTAANSADTPAQQINNDLATNDGAVIETLDTVFHNKPGVAEGLNPSGSNRADYYEGRSDGQSDAIEEFNPSPDI